MNKTRTGLSLVSQWLIAAVMLIVFAVVFVPAMLEIAQGINSVMGNVGNALSSGKINP